MAKVAPFVGAWIEISNNVDELAEAWVAPFAGAWIEIYMWFGRYSYILRCSVRRSVD